MSRLAPYLGIAAALVVGVSAVVLSNAFATPPAPVQTVATTTPALTVVPVARASSTPPALSESTSGSATSPAPQAKPPTLSPIQPPAKAAPAQTTPVSAPVAPEPTPAPAPSPAAQDAMLNASAAALRGALVNILCYPPVGSTLHAISGSGVFIDTKGIILTNAHIGQYFLLADRSVACTIRTGSPATDAYAAALIYISPSWIAANPTVLTQTLPSGTGEYDFALLAVTSRATGDSVPASFPAVPLAYVPPAKSAPVAIASYGAQFLQPSQIRSGLFPTIVFGSIKDIFTFGTNTVDVLDLGGSVAAQEGSSGGGVTSAQGELVGTITTSTVEGSTDTRTLSAITASYIRAQYARETGTTLDSLLSQPTTASVSAFSSQIPALESIVTAQIQ